MCVYSHVCMYIYRERERGREIGGEGEIYRWIYIDFIKIDADQEAGRSERIRFWIRNLGEFTNQPERKCVFHSYLRWQPLTLMY